MDAIAAPVHDQGRRAGEPLLVENFTLHEAVNEPFALEVSALGFDARVDLQALLGQRIELHTALADGSRTRRSALITGARQGAADGGFARYHLSAQPWVALLAHSRHSRVWQDKTLMQILDDVLGDAAYTAHAAWQWGEQDAAQGDDQDGSANGAEDIADFLAQGPKEGVLPYCVQYR